MVPSLLFLVAAVGIVGAFPYLYGTSKFRVGIEYDKSLPMYGGSDRYRHVNNYDPFFVTVTTTAKNGYVISYIDVTATVAASGEVDFRIVRGSTGLKSMTFQLVSNHSDFLSYSYLAYGIREEEYKKVIVATISNIITIPMGNKGSQLQCSGIMIITIVLSYSISLLSY